MKGYRTDDVARLLGLPPHRIRSYARAGFVTPERGPRNEYLFSFQDLVLLRTAAELARSRVAPKRISEALSRLRARLPTGRTLSGMRIYAAGDEIVVSDSAEPPWNPRSGQFHIEFDVADLADEAVPVARSISWQAHAAAVERSAAEWFELGLELEAVTPDEARAAYERALAADATLVDARINLGRLLQEAGRLGDAETHYRTVLETGEHALAAYNLALVMEDLGRAADAIRAYGRALAADPELAEAHFNLARIYEKRGDSRAAIRHFNGYRAIVRGRPD
jgi:tetratricopeptide (TPR) repeat protein